MNKKEIIGKYIMLTIGVLIASISLEIFLIPNTIIDGGITGISIIASYLSKWPLGLFTFVLNTPFIVIGWKQIGKRFAFAYLYSIILLSVFLSALHGIGEATQDILLASVFGGVLLGIGVGLVIRFGACMDGTEMVAILINKKTGMSVGQVVMVCNIFILGTAGLLFGWDRAMYSLVTYFVAFKAMDMIIQGLDETKAAIVITDYGDEISQDIFDQLGRTVTFLEGRGMISGKKDVLYCIMSRVEIAELKQLVTHADRSAFVSILEVADVLGGHQSIKKTKKNKLPII